MTTSAWGVDHGIEFSKADKNKFTRNEKLTGAATALTHTTPIGAIAAGAQAKKGKGVKVGLRSAGRGIAEGLGGATIGGAVGAAVGRGKAGPMQTGAALGNAAGTGHGVMSSMRNSRKKGWMK